MANGANRTFLKEKQAFLKKNIINIAVTTTKLEEIATGNVDPTRAVLAQRGRVANRDAGVGQAAGVYEFDMVKSTARAKVATSTIGIKHFSSVPVYDLQEWGKKTRDQIVTTTGTSFNVAYRKPNKAHPILAYWVPWSGNACWSVQLGNDADFFFTPTMDGCSLAITGGVSPVVTHGNYKNAHGAGPRASQTRTLRKIDEHHLASGFGAVQKTLGKNQYAATHAEKTQGINHLVTVVGIRNTATNLWTFYWQKRMSDANNLNAPMILEGRNVIM